ncbi:MAG: response regulator transcription factor [Thermodesulfobacteriota bacterium]
MKLVIADDSSVVRERLIAMLSKLEEIESIGQAQDVGEAINSIEELKPDAVILDIQMPGGSGIEVLKHIKKEQPATVVIILTNYPYPQYRQECMDEGADFFFDKSLEFGRAIEVCKGLARCSDV